MAAVLVITLSSCIIEPDECGGAGPQQAGTRSTTHVSRTLATRAVVHSEPVYTNDANYLYFNGNGAGLYYYLINGYRQVESIRYWSQNSNSGTSYYPINIQYEY